MTSLDHRYALLAPFLESPERAAVLTDFDGTLSPMVGDPAEARPLPGAVALLHRLAVRFGRLGVVSGRPVHFLRERLECHEGEMGETLLLVGLYGMERSLAGEVADHPEAVPWRPAVAAAADAAEAAAPPGVHIERKGLSVALHFRTAPHCGDWARAFAEQQAARTGLRVVPARMAYELRPPVEVDKGTIVLELTAGFDAACFLGDDRGDLEAFAALDRRRDEGMHVLKVAARSPEVPPELLAEADLIVDGPEGALAVLQRFDA